MALLGTGVLTLLDLAKRLGPDHKIARLVEMLAQTNDLLRFIPFVEANNGETHTTTMRTSLPTVQFRSYNEAVAPTKSDSAQAEFATGLMTAFSKVDEKLAQRSADVGAFRLSEASSFIEAMNQKAMSTFFYGNQGTSPKEFNGLSRHYNALATTTTPAAANVINAAGTEDSPSDLASIWLISFSEGTVHGIYPSGSASGLEHIDRGVQMVPGSTGAAGSLLAMLVDEFNWFLGLAIRDWRAAGRVVNIDVGDRLVATDSVLPSLVRRLVESVEEGTGRQVLAMNRTVKFLFDEEVRREVSAGGGITYENVEGKRLPHYMGIPIVRVDALLSTETAVA